MPHNASEGRSAGQIVLIVVGSLAGLVALVLLAAGGLLIWTHETKRDADGYYATGAEGLATPTYALVSERLDVGTDGPDWLFRRGRLGAVRVSARAPPAIPLRGDWAYDSCRVVSALGRARRGDRLRGRSFLSHVHAPDRKGAAPTAPSGQGFWAVRASGAGRQTLTWPVRKGSWAVVVMNVDATKGVRADVSVGARLPLLFWLAIGLLGAGVVLGVAAGAAVFFGSRAWQPAHAAGSLP